VGKFANVGVTQTLSKAHSLAGFRVGYCVMPQHIAGFLNTNNDAYPLARAAQAAAIATLQHEDKIKGRVRELRSWAQDLASELESLGVRTFPSESYFFLADFSPHDASHLASLLRERDILIKPLNDERLGPGYMRVTTALPVDNEHFVTALREVL
jgi:histidinol-phosphate aminotransferase